MREHPFAVGCAELDEILGLRAAHPTPVEVGTAVLALPTQGRGPVASPELPHTAPPPHEDPATGDGPLDAPTSAKLWRIPTLLLDPDAALTWLTSPPPLDSTSPDTDAVVAGPDLRHLRALAWFAVDLVGRGRVLPTVRATAPGYGAALWSPVVTGVDSVWLRAAVRALPRAGVAAVDSAGAPSHSPVEAVSEAVDALVDAAVRAALGPAPRRRSAPSWRDALRGQARTFAVGAGEVAALAAGLGRWEQDATAAGAVRACFRLTEPLDDDASGGEGVWRLGFALQSADEPSLVVEAAQVWKSKAGLRALARHVPNPQETLLAELGRAVRLYPEITPALRTAKPAELVLDTAAAHAFLAQAAPVLVASGFGVLLPSWWTTPSARLGARLRVSTPSQPGAAAAQASIGQDGLVDFQWDLAVGEHTLTQAEVDDLVDAQQPLVRLRGQWMQVDAGRLARARAFLSGRHRATGEQMSVAQVLHALGSTDDGPGGLPVVGVAADGWLGDLLSPSTELRLEPVPVPAGFVGSLRGYQERGLSWLSFLETIGMGALLADDMGLGKTIQLLALIAGDSAGSRPTLLVCPMSLVGNWQREAARFTPGLRVHVHHGAERARGTAFTDAVDASDLVVTTYALLARDAVALRKVRWHRLVLDEAQAVKNAATKAAVAARSLPAPRRIAVTGTPVENRLADLWSLMEFANPHLLGNPKDFKDRFSTPIERHGDAAASTRLRALTQPFVLRRLKTDTSIISDLPAKLEMEVICSLTGEQGALYQGVVTDMLERIATTTGIERRGLVLATMTKLKQVCNHPAQFLRDGSRTAGRSGKLARLDETLDEVLAAGEKALIFTQYAEFGAMLTAHLTARFAQEVMFLHGGVSKAGRDTMVNRFQNEDRAGPPLFVLSLKAGGTGLNLTAANHVIHVDRWWNPAVEDQATDRAFRIGQTRPVQVRKFVCAGTLEEKIAAMIHDKRGLAASAVGTGEGWLTELSTTQLRDLFTLDAGAVIE
ncbi:MAG: DEAD/DEAH box helicase [Cellulomonas sp.]